MNNLNSYDINVPSSLSQVFSVTDRKYREHDNNVKTPPKDYCICKGCSGKAIIDSYDSTDPKTGVVTKKKTIRCVEKRPCAAYDDSGDSDTEMYKVSDFAVALYLKLNKLHRESIAEKMKLTCRFIGYTCRTSQTRSLIPKPVCLKLEALIQETYQEVVQDLQSERPKWRSLYKNINLLSTGEEEAVKIGEQVLSTVKDKKFVDAEKSNAYFMFSFSCKDDADLMFKALELLIKTYYEGPLSQTRDGKALKKISKDFGAQARKYYGK